MTTLYNAGEGRAYVEVTTEDASVLYVAIDGTWTNDPGEAGRFLLDLAQGLRQMLLHRFPFGCVNLVTSIVRFPEGKGGAS